MSRYSSNTPTEVSSEADAPLGNKGGARGCGHSAAGSCSQCDLEHLAFCAGLTGEDADRLMAIRSSVKAEAHSTVFREGDMAEYAFSLISGSVKIYKLLPDGRRQIIGFLYPGDFFGFAPDGVHAYTAETLTAVVLCRFPEVKLVRLIEETPAMERKVLKRVAGELALAHEHMLLLGRKTAREKIASFLLRLVRRRSVGEGRAASKFISATAAGTTSDGHHLLYIPMSRSDIADHLGLTIETVSRTLTSLKREGMVSLPEPTRMVIHDLRGMEVIAEGN